MYQENWNWNDETIAFFVSRIASNIKTSRSLGYSTRFARRDEIFCAVLSMILVYSGVTRVRNQRRDCQSRVDTRDQALGIGISNREHSRDLELGVSLELIRMKFWTSNLTEPFPETWLNPRKRKWVALQATYGSRCPYVIPGWLACFLGQLLLSL